MDVKFCHTKLSHIRQERMNRLAREGLLGLFHKIDFPRREHFLAKKATKKSFEKGTRTEFPLSLIHSDICYPMNVRARHDALYFITFIDDFIHFGHVYLISHNLEILECFKRYMTFIENQLDKTIKVLSTDWGRKYLPR